MNTDLQKFEKLLLTDTEFQQKLQNAAKNYTDDASNAEAIFNQVIVPVAKEYGISATYEEYVDYLRNAEQRNADLSPEELSQVAGGAKDFGLGVNLCFYAGVGMGKTANGFCFFGGASHPGICVVGGVEVDE